MNSYSNDDILEIGLGQQGTSFAKKLRDNGKSIHGYDIDSLKREKFLNEFPDAHLYEPDENGQIVLPPGMPTIVASNTPNHEGAITERIKNGTKSILTEEPLALNLSQTVNIITLAKQNHVDLYTALLIRFSPAIEKLKEFMKDNNLIMVNGEVDWGKNRIGNNRPTAGDLEDEAVHGMDILLLMASLNQDIESMTIRGKLGFESYVDMRAQSKMHKIDPSYPLYPNASSHVMTSIATTRATIRTLVQSSFVAPTERRIINLLLAHINNPGKPLFSAQLDFDKRLPEGGVKDLLQIWDIQNQANKIPISEYSIDKMAVQIKAWLDAMDGIRVDSRLATTDDALKVAQWKEGVLASHEKSELVRIIV